MSREIESYNSQQEQREDLKRVFWPSLLDFLFYLIAGGLILLLLNTPAVWRYFNSSIPDQQSIRDIITQSLPFMNKLGDATQGRVFLALFWMVVGLVVYILYWFLNSMFINFRNNIIVGQHYLHPTDFSRTRYWVSIFNRNLFFTVNLLVIVAYIYAGVKLMIALGKFSSSGFSSFQPFDSLSKTGLAVICAAFVLHFFFMLIHITIRSWRRVA
jgi:hypothetical protein